MKHSFIGIIHFFKYNVLTNILFNDVCSIIYDLCITYIIIFFVKITTFSKQMYNEFSYL